jgi:hypothetical protein
MQVHIFNSNDFEVDSTIPKQIKFISKTNIWECPRIALRVFRGKVEINADYESRYFYSDFVLYPEKYFLEFRSFGVSYFDGIWYGKTLNESRPPSFVLLSLPLKETQILKIMLEETRKCVLKDPPKLTLNKVMHQKDLGEYLFRYALRYGRLPKEYEALFYEAANETQIQGYNNIFPL